MKRLGIVRRVDDLGRIVIPKDARKMLGIEEGQPMEMFIDSENNLILKKYKPEEEYTWKNKKKLI